MDFRPVRHDRQALEQYATLFAHCFANAQASRRFSIEQLSWLYQHNPDGPALGFDAFDHGQLVAHYVLLPSRIRTQNGEIRALLSLNTATHPGWQGRGLFTQLAGMALDKAREEGFSAAYGVANANSTPGFVRKLGFSLIAPLQAKVGLFRPRPSSPATTTPAASFERIWTAQSLRWRTHWPANPVQVSAGPPGTLLFQACTNIPGLLVTDQLSCQAPLDKRQQTGWLQLYIGLMPLPQQSPGWLLSIPERLKPSPLNLIFKPLQSDVQVPHAQHVRFSFLDFDAF